jgi:hypothetical protein
MAPRRCLKPLGAIRAQPQTPVHKECPTRYQTRGTTLSLPDPKRGQKLTWRQRIERRGLKPKFALKYEYRDSEGIVRFEKQRFNLVDDEGEIVDKAFTVAHRPNAEKQPYIWKTGVGPYGSLFYRMPEMLKAARRGDEVWWTEGEKDADNAARAWGIPAFCHYQGNACANESQLNRLVEARRVNIVMDRDRMGAYIGWYHYHKLVDEYWFNPTDVRLWVPNIYRNKADLTDHIEAGKALEDLELISVYDIEDIAEEIAEQRANAKSNPGWGSEGGTYK